MEDKESRKTLTPNRTIAEMIESGDLDGYKIRMTPMPIDVDVRYSFTESLQACLDGRRVLMVAKDAETGDKVQRSLEQAGLKVQRANAEDRLRTRDVEGQPFLPTGEIVIVSGNDLEAMRAAQIHSTARALDAILTTVDRSMAGSTVDHVLITSPEDALEDAARTLNLIMNRMVEADIVDDHGGIDRLPAGIRTYMTWIPKTEAARMGMKPLVTGTRHRFGFGSRGEGTKVVIIDGDQRPHYHEHRRELDRQNGPEMLDSEIRINPVENGGFELAWPIDLDSAHFERSGAFERLFSVVALEREQRLRRTYVLRDESAMLDMPIMAELPQNSRGFDHRAQNQQFNLRQGRSGRGTPGKRGGGRK